MTAKSVEYTFDVERTFEGVIKVKSDSAEEAERAVKRILGQQKSLPNGITWKKKDFVNDSVWLRDARAVRHV